MSHIDAQCSLSSFRRFLMTACNAPKEYRNKFNWFPERVEITGVTYVEAEDKATRANVGMMQIVEPENIAGIMYNSRSGKTSLKWRRGRPGRIRGKASQASVSILVRCGVIPTAGHFTIK